LVGGVQRAVFDTDVLVYAYGDGGDARHQRAIQLLEAG